MSARAEADRRIDEIRTMLAACAGTSPRGDDIDAVIARLDALAEAIAAGAERRDDERKYHTLVENLPGIAYRVHVADNRMEFLNERLAELTGFTSADLGSAAPCALLPLIHDDDRARVVGEVDRKSRAGKSFVVEYRLRRRDGSYGWMREFGRGILGSQGELTSIDGLILDVDASKLLEEQMRHTQRMEAIGTLAGGMAHEVNNVLSVILSFASVLESELGHAEPHRADASEIIAAARRGKELVENLLGFARKSQGDRERCSLNEIVRDLAGVLAHTLPKRITMASHLAEDADLGAVRADRTLLTQALLNVALNAADSIAGRGTITIATEAFTSAESLPDSWSGISPGWFSIVRVTDTGIGMDEETRRRACEPFFTTKATGQGTGLGLSMVYAVVRELGGKVEIFSREEQGTTVTIYLPAVVAIVERVSSRAPADPPTVRGTVLVVDDEAMVLRASKRALERLGCTVATAEGGAAALDIYRRRGDEIDLVIIDLSMPGMSGAECFAALRGLDPGVRALVCTGHATSEADVMMANGALGIMMKPFTVRSLSAAVRSALLE